MKSLLQMVRRILCDQRYRWFRAVIIVGISYGFAIVLLISMHRFFRLEGLDIFILTITPPFVHKHLILSSFVEVNILPNSRYFGYHRISLSAQESKDELGWKDRMLLRPSPLDCSNFSTSILSPATYIKRKDLTEDQVLKSLIADGFTVSLGGRFEPIRCTMRETVAIIIPYRARRENLMVFLNYMHRFLQQQNRNYIMVIAEQGDFKPFNRAKLMNAVVRELMKDYPHIDCFVLQDVDKLPSNRLNIYGCGLQPRQLITSLWTPEGRFLNGYYPGFLGGSTAFTKWQLIRMNGASNCFYGWGAEDDDMSARCGLAGYIPVRDNGDVGKMVSVEHHDNIDRVPSRFAELIMSKIIHRMREDGMIQANYVVNRKERRKLYTLYSFLV